MTRVSIIMLTYNQQDFVAEAIGGALSQQCEPAEVIISDDCSTDATWDVIQREVLGYKGPHVIRLNRNARNQGVNAHLWSCVTRASGDILVAMAGDDVSERDRVRRIVEVFDRSKPLLVHSQVTAIRDPSSSARLPFEKALFFRTADAVAAAGSMQLYVGATAAWHRDIFAKYGPIPDRDCYEDLVLGFRASLEGRVDFIADPLVRYRVGIGISAARSQFTSLEAWTDHRIAGLRRNLVVLDQRIKDAATYGLRPDHPVMQALHHHVLRQTLRVETHASSFLPYLRKYGRHLPAALSAWQSERTRRRKAVRSLRASC